MKLLVQRGDGITPLVEGISKAKDCIEIMIFRCDRSEIEKALGDAVSRGVHVHALITYINRGGEKNLRKLETRLLGAGVTVARTADDLTRYHGKLMIIDRRELYVLAFNLTRLDIDFSRSFGVVTRDRKLVQEAAKLFEADAKRQSYEPGLATFLVSPANARKELSAFIKGAKKELLIYDLEISDPAMIRLLEERSKAGVDIRIFGRLKARGSKLMARKLHQMRLHTRTIIRDRCHAFIGSQSLRALELDSRREIGVIFRDSAAVSQLIGVFEEDWALTEQAAAREASEEMDSAAKVAKKVAKVVTKEILPITPVLEGAVKEVVGDDYNLELNAEAIEATVKDAVKEAVKEAVRQAVAEGAIK
jgi:cardiolipin synthase